MGKHDNDFMWNYCEVVWQGKQCINKARYRNGKKCCTCFNRLATIKDPERVKGYAKNYYDNNREAVKIKQKRYYDKHQQTEKDRNFIYRHTNQEKVKEYNEKVHNPRRRAKRAAERAIRAQTASQEGVCSPAGEPQS